ncbi:MAG: hypothetical protein H8K03_11705 [Nitrospira sp.]|nr:hypothetical protein [Nitrospira sp. BO4]
MSDYRQSIREHLVASKKLLETGDLSNDEPESLRKKIEGLSALLGEEGTNAER